MSGFSRETTIRRDAHGRWYEDGVLVENDRVRRAFDRWVDVAEDGRYCLRNEVNWAYVEIDGSPLFVEQVQIDRAGAVWMALSDSRTERLDPSTLVMDEEGVLYCRAREGRLEAKFTSGAAWGLEPVMGEDERGVWLEIEGRRIRPTTRRAPEPDSSPPPPR